MSENPAFSLPENRNWELIINEDGKIERLEVNDKGEIKLLPPFTWECIRCGEHLQTPIPEKPGEKCPQCNKRDVFKAMFPEELKALYGSRWHLPWQLPSSPKEVDPLVLYAEIKDFIRQHLVLTKTEEYDILTLWTMATWKVDDFLYCPYLLFRGEIESGKTRALDVFSQLAYHGIGTVGATPAVLRKQVEWFRCTCLIDQAEDQLSRKFEAGQQMYRLVAAGYKKGMFVARCREGHPDKIDYDDPFGFKAFASTKSFDAAIDSRSIIIDMEEAVPEKLDIDKGWGLRLRSKLLHWRLTQHSFPEHPETKLRGRTRELFSSLLAIAEITDAKAKVEKFAFEHHKARRMELLDEVKAGIVEAINSLIPKTEDGRIHISDIKTVFEDRGFEISSSYIGRLLTDLAIPRKNSSKGRYVDILETGNIKKLEYWLKKYGLQKEDENKLREGMKVSEGNQKKLHEASFDERRQEDA